MEVQPSDGAEHHVRGQITDLKVVVNSEAFDKSARAGGNLDQALSRIVEVREIIAACGEKPPDFRDGIVGVKALGTRQRSDARECRSPAVRKRKLLLAIGRVGEGMLRSFLDS